MLRIALMIALVGGTAGFATLWLTFQHKPEWYKPTPVDDRMLRETRSQVAEIADDISGRIVQSETFDLSFTDETVNRWLAALPHVWPDARRNVPPEFRDIAVRFEEGRIRIASLYAKGGWRAVPNVAIDVALDDDGRRISLQLAEVRGGSLSVPDFVLSRFLDGVVIDRGGAAGNNTSLPTLLHFDDAADLLKGTTVRNRFVWPNGERPFRIDAIELTDGRIRLRLQPL